MTNAKWMKRLGITPPTDEEVAVATVMLRIALRFSTDLMPRPFTEVQQDQHDWLVARSNSMANAE